MKTIHLTAFFRIFSSFPPHSFPIFPYSPILNNFSIFLIFPISPVFHIFPPLLYSLCSLFFPILSKISGYYYKFKMNPLPLCSIYSYFPCILFSSQFPSHPNLFLFHIFKIFLIFRISPTFPLFHIILVFPIFPIFSILPIFPVVPKFQWFPNKNTNNYL